MWFLVAASILVGGKAMVDEVDFFLRETAFKGTQVALTGRPSLVREELQSEPSQALRLKCRELVKKTSEAPDTPPVRTIGIWEDGTDAMATYRLYSSIWALPVEPAEPEATRYTCVYVVIAHASRLMLPDGRVPDTLAPDGAGSLAPDGAGSVAPDGRDPAGSLVPESPRRASSARKSTNLFLRQNLREDDAWTVNEDESSPDGSDVEGATMWDQLVSWAKDNTREPILGMRWFILDDPVDDRPQQVHVVAVQPATPSVSERNFGSPLG